MHKNSFYLGLVFLCSLLSACHTISDKASPTMHLPPPSQLGCCWQKLETIAVHNNQGQGEVSNILAIIVRDEQSLSVSLISPEGQQLMSINQVGTNYSVNHFVDDTKVIPEYLILYGIYLSYSQIEQWAKRKSNWSVYSEPRLRSLSYLKKEILTLIDRSNDNSWTDRTMSLPSGKLVLDISLVEHLSLQYD